MLIVCLLSFALMAADLYWPAMDHYRGYLRLAVTPVEWLVDAPTRVWGTADKLLADRGELQAENDRLRADMLMLARKLQRLEALSNENAYLRSLLNASQTLDDRVIMAELIGVNPDPFLHQITINKGLRDSVYLGQPVLDAGGVMGQVMEVGPYTARVLLITDTQHAVPVQVVRSGFRTLLLGNGDPRELTLDNVPDTADIEVGDLLVSSGLGQRFPSGYPVGRITEIEHDPGRPFALVKAEPTARLSTSRHVLLVFRQGQEYPSEVGGGR
nr:rod shape-determining protein MreC [Motiliproteus sp. SC1-56]